MGEALRNDDPVYDNEDSGQADTRAKLRALEGGGESTPERATLSSVGSTPDSDAIKAAEEQPGSAQKPASDKEDSSSSDKPNDQVGKGYNPSDKKGKKFWTRRKKISGAVVGVAGASIIGIGSVLGPGMAVVHLRSLLLEQVAKVQIDGTRRYRRAKFSKMTDAFSTDGRRGGAIIAEMERSGYKFSFDRTDKTKITGITLPGRTTSLPNFSNGVLADHIESYLEVHHPLRTSRWKTKRMEAFYSRYKVSKKAVTTRTGGEIDDPERTVNKELYEQVAGEEPETRVTGGEGGEGETKEEAAAREERNAANTPDAEGDGALTGIKDKLREGVPIDELTDEEQKILKVAIRVDQEVIDLISDINTSTITSQALGSVKALGSSTDVLDKLCTAKNRARALSLAKRTFQATGSLRLTASMIKVGDDVLRGTPDAELLGEVMKRVNGTDANGNAIGGSPGFAYLLKNKFSRSKNNDSKGRVGVDGSLTGVPGALQSATDKIPAISQRQCGVYQNPAFQIGFAVVELGAGLFSGGATLAAGTAEKAAVSTALKESLRSILTRQTARSFAKGAATGAVIDIGFEGALTLLQFNNEKAQTLSVTAQERGGELGDVLAAGAGTLNKQRSLQAGMVPATVDQYAASQQQYFAQLRKDRESQSLFTRYLDYDNPDSFAFQAASQAVTTPLSLSGVASMAKSGAARAASLLTNPWKLFGGMFSSSVGAQDSDEISFETYEIDGKKLATDPAGNLLPIMRQDILDIDPEENIRFLIASGDIDPDPVSHEPISDDFTKHVENCVTNVDTISTIENKSQSDPKYDCLASQPITVRYKAHLAWLDMVDGVDAALFPNEIAPAGGTPPPSSSSTAVVGNTSNVPCAAGSTDASEAIGGAGGEKYRIRMCEIPGFVSNGSSDTKGLVRINSTVSGQWASLFEKSKQGGLSLTANSSFRSYDDQAYLYNCYITKSCNGGNLAAKPGTSNHEMGFAVDINIAAGKDPSLDSCKANTAAYPVYSWLAANAPALGINASVDSECWHWSSKAN